MSAIAYIALGSNLGDKMAACQQAIDLLKKSGQVKHVSSFYCTEPVGYPNQEDFVNAVIELETDLSSLRWTKSMSEVLMTRSGVSL